jgi:hypothetical protein
MPVKRQLWIAAAGLIALLGPYVVATQYARGQQSVKDLLTKPQDAGAVCNGDFGTNVKFLKTPSDAARQALKEEKLVFVLHVSGDFEDPDFT